MQNNDDSESTRSTERLQALGEINYRRRRFSVCLALLIGCCVHVPLRLLSAVVSVDIYAPSIYQHIEAPGAEFTPFDRSSSRYQQVYSSSLFGAISNGGWITEFAFRVDTPDGYGFRNTLPNLQINLSTTTLEPDQLSAAFSENVGADDVIVFGPTSASVHSGFSMTGPQGFEIMFTLANRFYYQPLDGNLLMDVRLFQGGDGNIPPFDAVFNFGDSISRVYGGIGASTGIRDSSGLVTSFIAIPVPEPSKLALCLSGAVLLGWWYRRKQIR